MTRVLGGPTRLFSDQDQPLGPYVPHLLVEWLRERPHDRHQSIDCTLIFADISGFTRMTELLGGRGKLGAEEMASLINQTFDPLIAAAYNHGAGLIKWGGAAPGQHRRCS